MSGEVAEDVGSLELFGDIAYRMHCEFLPTRYGYSRPRDVQPGKCV